MRYVAPALAFLALLCALAAACGGGTAATPTATPEPPAPTATPSPVPVRRTPDPTPDNSAYPAGSVGYAISWPQCGGPYPEPPFDFMIVGITGGKAFTRNPCYAEEYEWAKRGRYHPSVYMNLDYPAAAGAAIVSGGPCDYPGGCEAYAYGYLAAADAYAYAASLYSVAPVWWLDVQIVSDWSPDPALNVQAVRGATDYLESQLKRVGISSTAFQWGSVAGDAQHRHPVWDAGALDAGQAADFCATGKDFGGGRTEQIAWVDTFETVLACGPPG